MRTVFVTRLRWGWLLFLLVAIVLPGVFATAQTVDLTLQEAVARGVVSLESEGATFGPGLTLEFNGTNESALAVRVRQGDLVLSKQRDRQNFVIAEDRIIRLDTREGRQVTGVLVFCIDEAEAPPERGARLDVSHNITELEGDGFAWLAELLDYIESENLERELPAQNAIWFITDNKDPSPDARELILDAGIDPDETHDFPRLTNPREDEPDSRFALPPEVRRKPGAQPPPDEAPRDVPALHWSGLLVLTLAFGWLLWRRHARVAGSATA